MAGDPKDLKHAIKNFDSVARTQLRSDFTWNMAEALVAQCNQDTVIEGAAQPALAVELALLATNYANKYGSAQGPCKLRRSRLENSGVPLNTFHFSLLVESCFQRRYH